jgi:hypothetical protein
MQKLHGDAIIDVAKDICNNPSSLCAFATYEQYQPETSFGRQMVNNLMMRGCPLLSIWDYPDREKQEKR